jgi:hypothetical protein
MCYGARQIRVGLLIVGITSLTSPARSQVGGSFDLTWNTIDSGGVVRSTGGAFELSGTIGQPDAGRMAGGDFELIGGFWFEVGPGDCIEDGTTDVFDYFEFTGCFSGPIVDGIVPTCLSCFDFDVDDDVDMFDFATFQNSSDP